MSERELYAPSDPPSRARAVVAVLMTGAGVALAAVGANGVMGAHADASWVATRAQVVGEITTTSFRPLVSSTRGSNIRHRVVVRYRCYTEEATLANLRGCAVKLLLRAVSRQVAAKALRAIVRPRRAFAC